jgi:glutamine---fructose-6-phosphate transaminase (isomerizing)
VVAVVPGQLLARTVAEVRGIDVDQPGGLSKVTRTT